MLGVGILLGMNWGGSEGSDSSPYSAVYLETGDIYFGKLKWFPSPHMERVTYYQNAVDEQNRPAPGVAAFTGAFWKPIDKIYFNRKHIVFWTRLSKESQVAKAFDNPDLFSQPPQIPASNSTSTQ